MAYVVTDSQGQSSNPNEIEELQAKLEAELPDYMLPKVVIKLDELPLLPNGKVDRQQLPAPDWNKLLTEYVAPRNLIESQLVDIYVDVLGLEQVGIKDDFFKVGGHSLLAMQVVAQIREVFEMELPLRYIYEKRDVDGLAELIQEHRNIEKLSQQQAELVEMNDDELEEGEF